MPNTLTASVRPITNSNGRNYEIVEFFIDGENLRERLMGQAFPDGNIPENASLPCFTGVPKYSLTAHQSVFLNGIYAGRPSQYSNFAPLMACECGDAYCGGVFTQIHVGKSYVNWRWFLSEGAGSLSDEYPIERRLCVFERGPYEKLIRELILPDCLDRELLR